MHEKCSCFFSTAFTNLFNLLGFRVCCYFLDLPIPGNVFGLIFLFVLLPTGVVKVNYIEKAAGFLNKHLAFFYIPFGVGLMNYGDLIKTNGLSILVMIIGSSIIGLIVTSGSAQYLSRKAGVKHGQSDPH